MKEVPLHISKGLRAAIHTSMVEERAPAYQRVLKAFCGALVSSLFVLGAYIFLLRDQAFHHGISFFVSFFLILYIGFHFYFKPQPHWIVQGHWSAWSYGGLFALMGILTGVQFVLCPHFVLLHQLPHESFSPLDALARQYTNWGGVAGSKFLCGLTFSAFSSFVIAVVFRKQFWGAKNKELIKIAPLLLVAQAPAILIQVMDEHLRSLSYLWILGSVTAVGLFLAFWRVAYLLSHKKGQ
jgi:hypothetical protein